MICFWSVTPTAGIYTDCHTLTLHDELPIPAEPAGVRQIVGRDGAEAEVEILTTREELPWAGHMAVHALAEVYQRIRRAGTTLVFVNTRAQAERSEEHTSELQSLMRISYAVFCLNKKNNNKEQNPTPI